MCAAEAVRVQKSKMRRFVCHTGKDRRLCNFFGYTLRCFLSDVKFCCVKKPSFFRKFMKNQQKISILCKSFTKNFFVFSDIFWNILTTSYFFNFRLWIYCSTSCAIYLSFYGRKSKKFFTFCDIFLLYFLFFYLYLFFVRYILSYFVLKNNTLKVNKK